MKELSVVKGIPSAWYSWYYHLSDHMKGLESLCGRKTMRTGIKLRNWNSFTDSEMAIRWCSIRWCSKCEKIRMDRQ